MILIKMLITKKSQTKCFNRHYSNMKMGRMQKATTKKCHLILSLFKNLKKERNLWEEMASWIGEF